MPFHLYAVGPQDRKIALVGESGPLTLQATPSHLRRLNLIADRWGIGDTEGSPGQRVLPLRWRAVPNLQGIEGYGVDLDFEALQRWLERERRDPEDHAVLFRLNQDGTATLLALAPLIDSQLGIRLAPEWVAQARLSATGAVGLHSPLDGHSRRVAFHRLDGPADQLVIVYGVSTAGALVNWRVQMVYLAGLALLLAASMGAGGWRLDRSLRELTDSKRRFELALQSGHVWDWDIAEGALRYAPGFLQNLGVPPTPPDRLTTKLYQLMLPEDAIRVKAALRDHVVHHKPYAITFRLLDSAGELRWFETQGQAFWDRNGIATYMAGTTFEITQRLQLEESQRQTLQRLDTVANASPVLFWTADLLGQRDWVNQRWLTFRGHSLEQELGDGWMDGIHPDDLERRRTATPPDPQEQASCAMEYRLRHHDGSYRWVVDQWLPRFDADQQPIGYIGSCVDVTELKQAEAEARQRGAMLERVFDVLQDMLFVVDAEGRFLHYQGAADAKLYAPAERFLGRVIDEVMPGELASLLRREMAQAKNGQLRDFDYSMDLPGGRHHFNARLAYLTEGNQYMVVARDITERETLKEQRERLQQFLILQLRLASQFINHPLDTIDKEIDRALGEIGEFVRADRAYIFAYDMQANTASNTHEWCAPGIEPAIEQLQDLSMDLIPDWVAAHTQKRALWVDDVQALPQGNLRAILEPQSICSLITLPMNSTQGLLGFVGFDSVRATHVYDQEEISLLHLFAQMLVNVQERKQAEARLHELAAELEIRVQDRTRQLGTSVKRLSQANRELESFAYSVSHDLKSPLRSMEGFASLLVQEHDDQLGDEARDYLQRIQAATRHMGRLINDLLSYARIEQFEQGLTGLALEPLVTEVVQGMRNEIDALGAQVRVDIQPGLAAIAHPQGLAMVLRNLIDNALKFTQPGEPPEITIRGQVVGPVVRLSVADRGQGFDMRYHDRIFAIFQRLHRGDQTPGTGIGLAMVHKAIERMDGRIWADSTPGQGATFYIELPRA
ncbi:PAS domain S-box protein [Hydrogenophaga sp.]|uniref:PAS domain S-box protein n=1 Tax=Hydrogenophaga sp. TaxID=1904254 RepID=UPI0025BF3114|nr:PAS domain S-box protein [Hydrogenophaga sp.]